MKKIRTRLLRLENLEDRTLLAVTAGGETAAAFYAVPLATEAVQLAVPANFQAVCNTDGKVDLSWDAVSNASGYTVYYQPDGATQFKTQTTTSTHYQARELTSSKVYVFKIVANGDGMNYTDSEESAEIRCVPSVSFSTQVTTLEDAGLGTNLPGQTTFRQAVYNAALMGGEVTFADGLEGTVDLAAYGQIELLSTAMSFSIDGDNRITLTNTGTSGADRLFCFSTTSQNPTSGFDVTLSNLTLSGFSASADSNLYSRGGAIFVWNTGFLKEGDPYVNFTLEHCTVTDCSAAESGGAFYAYGGSITAVDTIFSGNSAPAGGVISVMAADFFLTDCTLTENTAQAASTAAGGAIWTYLCYASTLDGCTISNNSALITSTAHGSGAIAMGGAICLRASGNENALVINNTQFTGNIASCVNYGDGHSYCVETSGGALFVDNSGLKVYNSVISGNSALYGLVNRGGGVTISKGSANHVTFRMTDISDNEVGYKGYDLWTGGEAANCPSVGGGVFANGAFDMVNCTVLDNTVYASHACNYRAQMAGSAIYINADASIYDTTIAGNSVVGSGAYCNFAKYGDSAALLVFGSVDMTTSVVLGNYFEDSDTGAKTDSDIYSHAWMSSSDAMLLDSCVYNPGAVAKDTTEKTGDEKADQWNFDIRENCITVTDYQSFYNDYVEGDYTLDSASPAVDAADMSARVDFGYEYDIRGEGYDRIVNEIADIGAYELQASVPTFEVSVTDYTGDYDGAAHSVGIDGLQSGDIVYYSADGLNYSADQLAYTDPGVYTIYVNVQREGFKNFKDSGTVTINEVRRQLQTPADVQAVCSTNGAIDLSWTADANASGYTVYYRASDADLFSTETVSSASLRFNAPERGKGYTFMVVANGDEVNFTDSDPSAEVFCLSVTSYSTQVTTLSDLDIGASSAGVSFRQAVYYASLTGDNVTFADGLSGTIDLASYGQIKLAPSAKSFTIDGCGRITLTNTGTTGADRLFCFSTTSQNPTSGFDVTLSNLTLSGFSASADSNLYSRGGAIFVWNTPFAGEGDSYVNFTLDGCTVTGCSAAESGGAFYAYGGSITAVGTTFSGNSAPQGGAISVMAGDFFLTDCTLTANAAQAEKNAAGGAIWAFACYASTIDGCTISDNTVLISSKAWGSGASAIGGAVYLRNATNENALVINNTQITGNIASCVNHGDGKSYCVETSGGAFYLYNAGMKVYNSTITGNAAVCGLINRGGGLTITGTLSGTVSFHMTDISGNEVGHKGYDLWTDGVSAANIPSVGGAIYTDAAIDLVNCTVFDNTIYASRACNYLAQMAGSAIYFNAGASLYDTTIAGNRVVGSGTYCNFSKYGDSAALLVYGSVNMTTSVVLGNYFEDSDTGTKTPCDIFSHAWMSGSDAMILNSCVYNPDAIAKDTTEKTGDEKADQWNFDIRDNSVAVTDYQSFYNNYASRDYTLSAGSAAIDAADMSVRVDFGYEYDIRGEGFYRIVNSIADIGAYEFQSGVPSLVATITDYAGDYDGAAHTITVNGLESSDTVYYSADGVNYSTDVVAYTAPGVYTVYVKVEREGFNPFTGSGTVTINEASEKLQVVVVVSDSAASATEAAELPASISVATVGDTLYAQVWILNADGSANGCVGGYVDLNYTAEALSYTAEALSAGSYMASSIYANQATYADASEAGLVACFGGCSQTGVNNLAISDWALLGTFAFTASAEGAATVDAVLPTLNGTHIRGLNLARAGVGNFADSEIVFTGASFTVTAGGVEQLAAPTITTGKGVYVSYGANRHLLQWSAVENASGYEVAYTDGGTAWNLVSVEEETSAVIRGLTYGLNVDYKVRALGDGTSYSDSDWSAVKTFNVCPMDINNDGDISGGDRTLLARAWLAEEGEDTYRYYCDINADGDVGGADRAYLSNNWLLSVEDDADDLRYPPARRADAFFAEFSSADLDADLDLF